MFLIAGLGNPGPSHARNRHNIGFMAVDAVAQRYRFPPFRARFQGDASEGKIGDARALLLKPLTYMNESGRSVAEALRFYKVELDRLVVLHDELDLAPGKMRVKQGGGAAGHNGLRSLDAHLGPGYRRVRLGIGHPGVRDVVKQHVLQNFAKADSGWLDPLLDAIAESAPLLVAEPPGSGDSAFMSKVALILNPPPPKPPRKEPPPADGGN